MTLEPKPNFAAQYRTPFTRKPEKLFRLYQTTAFPELPEIDWLVP